VVGFGWTGLDWVGLSRTDGAGGKLNGLKGLNELNGDDLLAWFACISKLFTVSWRYLPLGPTRSGQQERKVTRIWSDIVGYMRLHELQGLHELHG
jgi:hypothetical protein